MTSATNDVESITPLIAADFSAHPDNDKIASFNVAEVGKSISSTDEQNVDENSLPPAMLSDRVEEAEAVVPSKIGIAVPNINMEKESSSDDSTNSRQSQSSSADDQSSKLAASTTSYSTGGQSRDTINTFGATTTTTTVVQSNDSHGNTSGGTIMASSESASSIVTVSNGGHINSTDVSTTGSNGSSSSSSGVVTSTTTVESSTVSMESSSASSHAPLSVVPSMCVKVLSTVDTLSVDDSKSSGIPLSEQQRQYEAPLNSGYEYSLPLDDVALKKRGMITTSCERHFKEACNDCRVEKKVGHFCSSVPFDELAMRQSGFISRTCRHMTQAELEFGYDQEQCPSCTKVVKLRFSKKTKLPLDGVIKTVEVGEAESSSEDMETTETSTKSEGASSSKSRRELMASLNASEAKVSHPEIAVVDDDHQAKTTEKEILDKKRISRTKVNWRKKFIIRLTGVVQVRKNRHRKA